MVANFNIDNKAGVDVGATYTITSSTPEYPAPPANPGDHILGNNGTEWVFVKNNSTTVTIAIYACVQLDASFNAVPITTTLANQLWDVAFAQVAIPPSQYGWVALRGENISVLSKGAVTKQSPLYTSTSAGILVNSTTSGTVITGVMVNTSYASTSTIGRSATASWPRAKQ